jgi:TPR repeat protein
MKLTLKNVLATIILVLSLAAPVAAGPIEDADAAFGRGDYAEAVKWFQKAANQGNAIGQSSLGVMYQHGKGVPQDYAEAAKWYRKAADSRQRPGTVLPGVHV